LPESAAERAELDQARAIRYNVRSTTSAQVPKMAPELLTALKDRLDGLQSLATFITQSQPLGRFREAMRFFELAFARPYNKVDKKLSQFLASGPFGYTREEVANWLGKRDLATHGDLMTPNVWDADVAMFDDRIQQAVYDILFNKSDWRSPSRERRQAWDPLAGTIDNDGTPFLTQGVGGIELSFRIFDGFGAYPHDLSANVNKPPAEWWCPFLSDLTGLAANIPAGPA
jgi:hypothetical protein